MSHIVIISGPPGSGKSTVAESLCERYDRTVHLDADDVYDWIRMGWFSPWKPESDRQNHMVSRAAARAAGAFAMDLYAVFIEGVIGPHLLPDYVDELRGIGVPVHFVLLRPSLEEVVRRGLSRHSEALPAVVKRSHDGKARMPEDLLRKGHDMFERWGNFAGITIDNTTLTADQTADRVMDACGLGEALVFAPEAVKQS